jgi:hypothetical protein
MQVIEEDSVSRVESSLRHAVFATNACRLASHLRQIAWARCCDASTRAIGSAADDATRSASDVDQYIEITK